MARRGILLVAFLLVASALAQNYTVEPTTETYGDSDASDSSTRTIAVSRGPWLGPTPNNFHVNLFGVDVYMSSISFAGTGSNVLTVAPGSSVSLSFNWNSVRGAAAYCPGCIVQWYWGMSDVTTPSNPLSGSATPARSCYSMGNWYSHGNTRSGSFSLNFNAPSFPGIQYFNWGATLDYQCDAIGFSQCPQGAWGAICVSGDTDGDGVEDCWDNCPCLANPSQGANDCPFLTSVPASFSGTCNQGVQSEPTLRNDYCGASRASTGFLSFSESSSATGTCPESFDRTFTATDSCSGAVQTATQSVSLASTCDTAATSISSSTASINSLTLWGGQGSPSQYLASVSIHANENLNDWSLEVQLPAGESLVSNDMVYAGAHYKCSTASPAILGLVPSGQWAAQLAIGGTVELEFVATNNAGLTAEQLTAATTFTVFKTNNS